MARRISRQKAHGPSDVHAHAGNHCRALVRVDGTGIRKKIKKDYERALRELDTSRRALDQFQRTDLPQFTRWLNGQFGALFTELRELNLKLQADDALMFLVQEEVIFGGGSYARAYKYVMEQRDNSEPPPPEGEPDQGDPFGAGPGWENPDDDPLDDLFEELGGFGSDAGWERPGPHGGQHSQPTAAALAAKRLKDLYRALVRLLHPDSQRQMTPQKTEWWHQAQAAYEAGDAQQLEVILTLCEIGESGTTAHTSASLLQRITTQLRRTVRQIKRQLTEHRREPAWNFSQRTDHSKLAEQMGRELKSELIEMQRRWMATQGVIAQWKAAAEKLKPSRRRKARPSRNGKIPF